LFLIPEHVKKEGNVSLEYIMRVLKNRGEIVEKIVIEGDWIEIPPMKSILLRADGKRGVLIDSDFRYSMIGQEIIPIVRKLKQDKKMLISGEKVLFFIDRPLRFHPDALYIYYLLKDYYYIHLWRSDMDNVLLNDGYEMIFHFGHANSSCYKVGNYIIPYFPRARILFSYGCHSAKAFMNLRPEILSFCGYSYFCYGQRPGFGSNELVDAILTVMAQGKCLSEAVADVKRWYVKNNGIKIGNSIVKSAYQFEEAINLLSLCTLNDYGLSHIQLNEKSMIQHLYIEHGSSIQLPSYEETLLVIISADDLYEHNFTLLDSNGNEIKWKEMETERYGSLRNMKSDFIFSKSNKGMRMVFNRYCNNVNEIPVSIYAIHYQIV